MEQKSKQKFLIKVDGIAPVSATYEVWAETEDDAKIIFDKTPYLCKLREKPFIDLPRMKRLAMKISNIATGFFKNFR
jgi:hypothetical protein